MAQLSARGGFLDFSPIKKEDSSAVSYGNKENNSSHPVLSLIQFSRAPFVTFGNVKLGSSKSSVLCIENPVEDANIEVAIDKIASTKGFSVDQTRFTIQPEEHVNLTITWTPIEEGGIRELITFIANGVVKHQAILLGRADAPKKRKKSLWDSIKSKKAFDLSDPPRGKKHSVSSLKMAANKTFHVSRTPQYRREKVRSPLASLNKKACTPVEGQTFKQDVLGQLSFDNVQNNSPVVFLVPAAKLIDSSDAAASYSCPVGTPECRDLTRLLNTTVSPVGTPERFQKLMPRIQSIQSPAPVIDDTVADISHTVLAGTPVLSVRDALVLIESDLTHVVGASPPNACSSFDFSHSLESANGEKNCGPVKSVIDLKALSESPIKSDPAQPRLTFFIKPKRVTDKEGRVEVGEVLPQSKKVTFTSTTVIKSKPAPVQVRSPGVRRIKTSRRRLLEKTLELSGDSGHSESSPGTTVTPGLPVIDSDANHDSPLIISPREARLQVLESISYSPVFLDDIPAPVNLSLSSPLPMNPPTGGPQHLGLDDSILGATQLHTAPVVEPLPDRAGVFPVYNQSQFDVRVVRSKKRKSDEFLRDGGEKVEDAVEIPFHVKKSRVSTVVKAPNRPAQQKGFSASSHRQHTKTSASVRTSSASSIMAPKSVSPAQAKQPAPKPGQRGAQSLKSFGGSSVKTAKIVAVAQSKLTFTKPGQTAIPRHPMPFAAKNMFYDERWIEKQETGFTWWINYVLTPDDFKVNTEVTKVNAVSLAMGGNDKFAVNKAPTKEEMSFSTYTARRRLNRLRRSACQLFTSEPMVKAIQRLELEVEARRLLVRGDRHLWKDIGERQKVLNWLLSYNPLWLRIGLETIYGEMISLESNSDVMGLALFILKRLLWNPDIAAEFRHAKVPNLYKDGHEKALSRFTLKKLLLLVCFLDKAKESRMIEHDPCLFCMDAEFKTTKDLLLAFSRDFLSGEGILPRHLAYMGLPVSHVQTPLDEFNFAVKNLSVDLKCGIRLVRVMELFIQDWSLSHKLRMPAISRLQKVHNVDIALQVLRARGVDLKDEHDAVIDSRDIVDGHREKTLSLLWKIIFTFQVEVLLDEDQLREEISFLKHTWTTKQRLASLRADKGVLQKTAKPRPPFEHSSSKITLLMEWVSAVCQFYHLKAENFTVSFSDGRILCYLIHHYHPSHLPADSVSHNTTQTVECSQRGRVELNSSSSDSDISFDTWPTTQNGLVSPSMEFKELLENEKNNFRLVNTAVSDLGGVPAMMNPADMSNTIPNEKVVTCYLSFLCARLLDLRNETRAARVIQEAWRKYRLKKDLKLYQERTVAAGKIQVLVRQFLQRRRAVCQTAAAIRIQAAWRGYKARNALTLRRKALLWALQVAAATTIQAQWKKYVTLKNYQRLRLHVVKVQALWRMKMAVTTYRRTQWAATVIQKHVRASTLAREERERYCSLRSAAVKIQRNYRRRKTRRLQRENHAATVIQTAFKKWHSDKMSRRTAAALKIQSCYRMRRCLEQYMSTQRSAILIQTWCRGHAQRRNFETLKLQHHSATIIQSAFRASTVRKQMATMRQSSVVIQRWFRASVQRDAGRQQFLKMRCAAVTIQSAYRGHTARRLMQQQNQAATVIQTTFMKFVARRKFLSLKKSAIVVQQRFRAKLVGGKSRKEYMALQYSALRIQSIWRGRAERKRKEKLHKCATLIQSSYRRHVLQSQFRSRKEAALAIQSQYRAYRAGKTIRTDYLLVKKAAVTVQARFRGMRVRQEQSQKHQAATVLQSVVRVFLCRRRYVLLQRAAIVLQCRYRALVAGRTQRAQYSQLKLATVKLQAAYRGDTVRRDLRTKHQAAMVIQARLRMHKVRQAYIATKVAAIIVQQHYRANRLRDLQMQQYTSVKSAAVVIQAVYRGHRARIEVARMHHSAMVIQRRFLTFRDRKRFLAVKTAVLLCQQRCRDVAMVRKYQRDYLLRLRAATALQAAFRGMKVRKQFQTECRAAVLIQSHIRKRLQRAHQGFNATYSAEDISNLSNEERLSCSFEEGLCFWRQEPEDEGDWIRTNIPTFPPFTGPNFDHTFGNQSGYYIVTPGSPGQWEKNFKIRSLRLAHSTEPMCLKFWYHMYGENVHRLRVLVVRQTTSVVREASVIVVFQKEGNYGDSWNFGQVTLNSTADATVVFEAQKKGGMKNDIALDDISLTNGPCGADPPDPTVVPTPTTPPPIPPDCGGPFDLWEPNSTFSSPNYPHSYGNKASCLWTLHAREGWNILLHFLDFDVESTYDMVEVRDGAGPQSELLGVFTGTDATFPDVISTANQITVMFFTDSTGYGRGFRANFTSGLALGMPKPCVTGQYRCQSGECISNVSVCNGQPDCADSSDEADCVHQVSVDSTSIRRLQLQVQTTRYTTCGQHWNSQLSHFMCRYLGYRSGSALLIPSTEKDSPFTTVSVAANGTLDLTPSEKCTGEKVISLECDNQPCGVRMVSQKMDQSGSTERRMEEKGEEESEERGTVRVVGGTDSPKGAWPWMVSLYFRGRHVCGATLIDNEWLITAAHCVYGKNIHLSNWEAVLGLHSRDSVDVLPSQTRKVDHIIMNKHYNRRTKDADIAMMHLQTNINFTDYIQPICLPGSDQQFEAGRKCFIAGWGAEEEQGTAVNVLQQAVLPLVSRSECQKLLPEYNITARMVCAGYSEGGVDSCQGDSGGPLMCEEDGHWVQVGVISFGVGCGRPQRPGVYALVSQFADWVVQTRRLY